MMDQRQRFREIAELHHPVQHPFTLEKLRLVGDVAGIRRQMTHLDLGCGKGELLNLWAQQFQTNGIGVDESEAFIQAAQHRAGELDLLQSVTFVVDDPSLYPSEWHAFDVVSGLGGLGVNGLQRLRLMQTALRDHTSLMIYGDAYWTEPPPPGVVAEMGLSEDLFETLPGLLNRFEAVGADLVEMVLAERTDWDRYEAQQWMAVSSWLNANINHPDAPQFREWLSQNRRSYLEHGRRYLGWGVFVLRTPHFRSI